MVHRILAVAGLAGILAVPVFSADLAIEVRGVRSGDGRLFVAVHSPETRDTFPAGAGMVAGLQQRAHPGTIRFVLRDLPPGPYAVNAFHDEDGNPAARLPRPLQRGLRSSSALASHRAPDG